MKNYLVTLFVVLAIALPAMAQNTEGEEDHSFPFRTKVGGAGGVTPIVGMFDNKEIDKYLKAAGLPGLGSDPIYLVGGEGYGYIMFLKNVRMGGFGASGTRTISAVENLTPSGQVKKEVKYSVTYGGFLMDYVMPVADRLDIAIGGSIGGGSVDIRMNRDNGSFKDWSAMWTEYGTTSSASTNYTRNVSGSFGVFSPHVNVEYTVLTWFQLRLGVGYPIFFSPDWQLDEKFTIDNVPSGMKPQGYTVNAGIMFGFFGW